MRRAGFAVGLLASFVLGPVVCLGVRLGGLLGRAPAWLAHRRARVLLVAEFAPYAELLAATLRRAGYRPDLSHPRGAPEAVATGRYQIVVGGLVMPFITGLELLAAARQASPGAQVILLSGDPGGDAARVAIRRGALTVLDKRSMDGVREGVNEAFARVFRRRRPGAAFPLLPGERPRAA